MSDETVAQARRARILALEQLINQITGFRKHLRGEIELYEQELERLLDHEKAPDPDEAGARITEAVRLSNEEEEATYDQMIDHQRAKIDELEKWIGEREQQIARLLDTVASKDRALEAVNDEADGLANTIEGLRAEIEVLKASVARQSETISQLKMERAIREDELGQAVNTIQTLRDEIESLNIIIDARDDEIARIVDQDTEAERWKQKAHFLQDAVDSRVRVVVDQQKQIVELHRSCGQLKALLREIKAEALEGYAQKIERIVERGEDY